MSCHPACYVPSNWLQYGGNSTENVQEYVWLFHWQHGDEKFSLHCNNWTNYGSRSVNLRTTNATMLTDNGSPKLKPNSNTKWIIVQRSTQMWYKESISQAPDSLVATDRIQAVAHLSHFRRFFQKTVIGSHPTGTGGENKSKLEPPLVSQCCTSELQCKGQW